MKRAHPLSIGIPAILLLTLSVEGFVFFSTFDSGNKVKQEPKPISASETTPESVLGVLTPELATLENNDMGYSVNYPANLNVLYTQEGVEFTTKEGKGKIILKVKNEEANVFIQAGELSQSELSQLNLAAQTIKENLQFKKILPENKPTDRGRFTNVRFDPKNF